MPATGTRSSLSQAALFLFPFKFSFSFRDGCVSSPFSVHVSGPSRPRDSESLTRTRGDFELKKNTEPKKKKQQKMGKIRERAPLIHAAFECH